MNTTVDQMLKEKGIDEAFLINDVLVNIGASIIEEKLRINFGDDFVKQVSAMAEKEHSQITSDQLH